MKKTVRYLILSLIIIGFCTSSCKKEEPSENDSIVLQDTVSLGDQICYLYNPGSRTWDFDLDFNQINDFSIYQHWFFGSSGGDNYTTIILYNNYEVLTKSYTSAEWYYNGTDTIYGTRSRVLTKKFVYGDTILSTDSAFSTGSVYIAYHTSPPDWVISSGENADHLIGDNDMYIALKRVVNSKTYLGWIKVRVLGYSRIMLRCYHWMIKTNALIIDH